MLKLNNPTNIRQIIICSTLSERPVVIENYKAFEGGLSSSELKFLRLVELISTGAKFLISKNGSTIKYYPGIITNNDSNQFEYDCGNERNISYFLYPLLILALFGKNRLNAKLKGITNDTQDISVDMFSNSILPQIKKFGIEGELLVKVLKRGYKPEGQGEILFKCPIVRHLKAINLKERGKIKRIRGICAGAQINPSILNRIISSSREILNDYLPDVWIYSDFQKGNNQEKQKTSPGYSVSLVAEYNNGQLISIDQCSIENGSPEQNLAEKIGKEAALSLLDEILYCGFVDSNSQSMFLTLMSLSEKKISSIRLGRITPFTVENLRIIREFFGVTFKILPEDTQNKELEEEEEEENEKEQNGENQNEDNMDIQDNQSNSNQENKEEFDLSLYNIQHMIFSCYGAGLSNMSRVTN
ncbi:RNA 3-terminal phosphate cyclase family protein, putative [Ichthyophthirius multifiliis]|uniref:RNA 3-terminal phosphate cyclase family protein, putative n=1 Tax=Ichthyophthirius multifiliis TaxID=5932 RepID=G0R660_ICHMU|nr:RNA 3-terminal phosphate cyclase family protein, putative [Ichthyophthirius multifiliis]EGR27024.1 RNA 3-terminal phosphate cyclase family protein, putative [Ichthyophthirius multifiliis]|eukprot:XP_004023908.1 RNA 3-terminal phosphate cyclase family protein, putative [Ichthyophthirius multifiliis]